MDNAVKPVTNAQGRFPSTNWSVILRASGRKGEGAEESMEAFCRTYWSAVYTFLRQKRVPPQDAEDIAQDFFQHMLNSTFLEAADPLRGRFRSFLLKSLTHFLINWKRDSSREKRGGGMQHVSLDVPGYEADFQSLGTDAESPEAAYERAWARLLLNRVLDRLQAEFVEDGKMDHFEEFKVFLVGDGDTSPYAEVAARLGISERAVASAVYRLRLRYAHAFREEIATLVTSQEEVEDEIRHLLGRLQERRSSPGIR